MSSSIVISKHVIETIKSLPAEDRNVISNALAAELLLGEDPEKTMAPFQAMVYSMIRYYVKRDTERSAAGMASGTARYTDRAAV